MKLSLLLVFMTFFGLHTQMSFSQKVDLKLEDIYLKYSSKLSPAALKQLRWLKGSDQYLYESGNVLLQADAKTNATNFLVTLEKLNSELKTKFTSFPVYEVLDNNQLLIAANNMYSVFDVLNQKAAYQVALPEKALNENFDKKTFKVSFNADSNLFVSVGRTNVQVTSDGGKGIAYGVAVHRNEFGINTGTFWSPEANFLAFYRMDETMVTDYPLVDVTARVAKLRNIKYPMAGMASHQVKVGVYSLKDNSTKYLETGEPLDHYLTNIAWSPDEKFIFIAVVNREQNHMWLNQYDVLTGKLVKTLFEETDPHYVEPLHPMVFLKNDPKRFIWQSRRDGFNHLYVYDINGTQLKQLTSGNWEVLELLDTQPASGDLFFEANINNPLEKQLCKVNIKNGKMIHVTSVPGVHESKISSDGNFILDVYSSAIIPGNTDLLQANGHLVRNVYTSGNPLKEYTLGETTISSIVANDGKTPLYYRLIKPSNFDPAKKYPVIVYVYGGPHDQLVLNRWANRTELWQQYMAQKGYVCFTLDNRGSSNRGRDFENIIHRQVGVTEMEDQMTGIAFLKNLGYVDSTRIGIHGWSYGGFMTTSLMLTYPEIVKVGVAGGPVIDWKYYEVMYGERYMDTPQENPEGYAKSSCLDKSAQLKGKLLIIHGGQDPTVVWQNSLMFIENCIKNNKQIDYFVYPTHEHNVIGRDRLHLMQKVTDYFVNFL